GFRRAGPSTPLDEQYEIVGGSLRIRTVTVTEVVSYFPRWVIRITHGRSYDETVQVTRRRMHVLDLPHRDATPLRVWAGSSEARPNGARTRPSLFTDHQPHPERNNQVDKAQILIAANRGPVSFSFGDDGSLQHRRGAGGLVSGMISVATEVDSIWVCTALSDADRRAAAEAPGARLDRTHDLEGMRVQMLDIPEQTFKGAYNGVANSTLWFVQHMLYDIPNKPSFGSEFRRLWEDYSAYNNAFAEALVSSAAENAPVAVQDYHLALVPRILRPRRPDLRIAHCSHTPWAPPEYVRLLPTQVARELLEGMLGADRLGFHSPRWANAFLRCCAEILGSDVDLDRRTVEHGGRVVKVNVHPLGADAEEMRRNAAEPVVADRRKALSDRVGDTRLIVRVDRTELSKNIVRGLEAYRELLLAHPEWRGRVTHLAFAYPSRGDVA